MISEIETKPATPPTIPLKTPIPGPNSQPVQGEDGFAPAPAQFFQKLRTLADEHSIALFFDEVQCSIGRTGKIFVSEHTGVTILQLHPFITSLIYYRSATRRRIVCNPQGAGEMQHSGIAWR